MGTWLNFLRSSSSVLKSSRRSEREILTKLSDQKTLQRNVIVSLSVLYAVAATLDKYEISAALKPLTWVIWWISFVIVVLGAASSYIDDKMIGLAGEYIKKLEDDAGWPGWQTYFASKQRFWILFAKVLLDCGYYRNCSCCYL